MSYEMQSTAIFFFQYCQNRTRRHVTFLFVCLLRRIAAVSMEPTNCTEGTKAKGSPLKVTPTISISASGSNKSTHLSEKAHRHRLQASPAAISGQLGQQHLISDTVSIN